MGPEGSPPDLLSLLRHHALKNAYMQPNLLVFHLEQPDSSRLTDN
jgi:hypothetical protein